MSTHRRPRPRTLGLAALLTLPVAPAAGCGESHQPVVSGEAASIKIWSKPPSMGPGQNDWVEYGQEPGTRVDVYEAFIVVTTPGGHRHVCPHGWYSDLTLRAPDDVGRPRSGSR